MAVRFTIFLSTILKVTKSTSKGHVRGVLHLGMEIEQLAVCVKPLEQVLNPEPLAADVLDLAFVLPIHGFHDQPYQTGRLPGEFLQVDFHRIVRTVNRLPVMDEVAHLHVQQQRLVGILDVECVKVAVLGYHAHIGFTAEMFPGRLHTDDVLRTVCLARYQVGGTQIHVSYGRGENYMYGLVIRDFQTMRGNHLAEADLAAQSLVIISAACCAYAATAPIIRANIIRIFFMCVLDWLVNKWLVSFLFSFFGRVQQQPVSGF